MGRHKRSEERFQSEAKRKKVHERLSFTQPKFPDQKNFKKKEYTPLNASRTEIMTIMDKNGTLAKPSPMITPDEKRDRSRYCMFHGTHGHDTEECLELKREIERAIRRGELNQFIAK